LGLSERSCVAFDAAFIERDEKPPRIHRLNEVLTLGKRISGEDFLSKHGRTSGVALPGDELSAAWGARQVLVRYVTAVAPRHVPENNFKLACAQLQMDLTEAEFPPWLLEECLRTHSPIPCMLPRQECVLRGCAECCTEEALRVASKERCEFHGAPNPHYY
jgi:hypothetical protein